MTIPKVSVEQLLIGQFPALYPFSDFLYSDCLLAARARPIYMQAGPYRALVGLTRDVDDLRNLAI